MEKPIHGKEKNPHDTGRAAERPGDGEVVSGPVAAWVRSKKGAYGGQWRAVTHDVRHMQEAPDFWEVVPIPSPAALRLSTAPPDGWRLVPVEPTEAMKQAAFDVLELRPPIGPFATGTEARDAVYSAMLAAAPQRFVGTGKRPAPAAPDEAVDRRIDFLAGNIAQMVTEWVEGGLRCKTDWRTGLKDIIAIRLKRVDCAALQAAASAGRAEKAEKEAALLAASPPDYWEKIAAEVEGAVNGWRHAILLNHEAAHLFAWAEIARNRALAGSAEEGR